MTFAIRAQSPRRVSSFAAGLMALAVAVHSAASADAANELRYRISGDRLESFDGRQWTVTGGEMSVELFDDGSLELFGEGSEYAFYSVTSFSLDLVDQLGDAHSIISVPDGLAGSISFDPVEVPQSVLDIGIFTLHPVDANVELLVYDLSLDGQPVNPLDELGGPGFIDSYWIGNHLAPTMWSFASILFLPSLNVDAGEVHLVGELIPEPTTFALCTVGLLVFYLRRRRTGTSSRRRLSSKCRVVKESAGGADAVATN